MLQSFVLRWGYLALGIGTFFEGEAILIAGGALAHRGLLSLPMVMVAAFVGSVAGDQLWFQVGRRFGRRFLERRPHLRARTARAEGWLSQRGMAFVLGFRFIYGIRTMTPLFLGASGYPARRFVPLNILGGAVWAVAFGSGGWLLGASLEAALQRVTRVEELIGAAAIVVLLIWLVSRMVASRRRRKGSSPTSSGTSLSTWTAPTPGGHRR